MVTRSQLQRRFVVHCGISRLHSLPFLIKKLSRPSFSFTGVSLSFGPRRGPHVPLTITRPVPSALLFTSAFFIGSLPFLYCRFYSPFLFCYGPIVTNIKRGYRQRLNFSFPIFTVVFFYLSLSHTIIFFYTLSFSL